MAILLAVPASAQTFFCATTGGAGGQSTDDCVNSIQTAVPFLRIVPDARSGAMGDVGLAISPDANSVHFNASKLAFAEEDLGLSATYTPWLRALGLQDVYLAYLSGYKRISELETLVFGLRYFSLGNINFTDNNGMPIGTGRPNEFEITFGYARQLTPNFSVAINPKFIYSNLASNQTVNNVEIVPGVAGAADLSVTYRTQLNATGSPSNLTLAAAITNLGTKISYTRSVNRDFLPANLGLGAAWELNFDEFNSITFAFDLNKLLVPTPNPDVDWREKSMFSGVISSFGDAPGGFSEELRELMYSFGVEYWYDKQFAVRAGYYTEDKTKGNRKFFTVGLGLKYNIFGLNFSYLVPTTNQRNPLDNTLRFSLLFDFGAFSEAP
ncbi:MAG: type IX secretion system outer membrane channel protein PorV [Bacteroidota bacterium]